MTHRAFGRGRWSAVRGHCHHPLPGEGGRRRCPSPWPSARASRGAPKEHHPSKGESVMHEECLICGALWSTSPRTRRWSAPSATGGSAARPGAKRATMSATPATPGAWTSWWPCAGGRRRAGTPGPSWSTLWPSLSATCTGRSTTPWWGRPCSPPTTTPGGALDLEQALPEMLRRGSQVPGGACGFGGPAGRGSARGCMSPSPPAPPLGRGSPGAWPTG